MNMRSAIIAGLVGVWVVAVPVGALNISVDSVNINDGGPYDMNAAPDIIVFDSEDGTYGFGTGSNYAVSGQADLISGGSGVSVGGPVVRVTNFVADQNDQPGGRQVEIGFGHTFPLAGPYTVEAAFAAEVGDGTGYPVYATGPLAVSVTAGEDQLDYFDAAVIPWLGAGILPETGTIPPFTNPLHPAGGGATPYPLYGRGPDTFLASGPTYIGGRFAYHLDLIPGGGTRDQFILPSSVEVGFQAGPEPSTLTLIAALGALAWVRRRSRRR